MCPISSSDSFSGTWSRASTNVISLCSLGPAPLEHKCHCFPASVCSGWGPDLMVMGSFTDSSLSLVHFPSYQELIHPSLNPGLDDTQVQSTHSSTFCRRSVESYWEAFTLEPSSRFLLRHYPFSRLIAPHSEIQCLITPASWCSSSREDMPRTLTAQAGSAQNWSAVV